MLKLIAWACRKLHNYAENKMLENMTPEQRVGYRFGQMRDAIRRTRK